LLRSSEARRSDEDGTGPPTTIIPLGCPTEAVPVASFVLIFVFWLFGEVAVDEGGTDLRHEVGCRDGR